MRAFSPNAVVVEGGGTTRRKVYMRLRISPGKARNGRVLLAIGKGEKTCDNETRTDVEILRNLRHSRRMRD